MVALIPELSSRYATRFQILILAFFTLFAALLEAQNDVQVTSAIDQERIYENHPVRGIITIAHPENLQVDTASFQIENNPLKAEFVKETKISPQDSLIISIYRFEIPGKSKGLYVLPEVKVVVGGKEYKSFPSTYEVRTAEIQKSSPANAVASSTEASLRLEALAEGRNPLYPGERLRFIYRFIFSGNIELSHEELPLLDAEGFLKIGDKEIKDYAQGQFSINEITQTVEAVKPGDYSFGPSVVEGYSYQESAGRRIYSKDILKSEAPPVKITVKAFPEKGKPASFNGAIGKFTFDVSLKSPKEVNVGDEMTLSIDIGGEENLNTAALPEMCCQPGFSGFFRLGDLPPAGEVRDNVKSYQVTLRPLTDVVKAIPSVEFSYFDPDTEEYTVLNSREIPITVKPSKSLPVEDLDKAKKMPTPAGEVERPLSPEAIEIHRNFALEPGDLHNKLLGTWWTMLVIPIGIAFLIFQNNLRYSLLKKQREARPVTSTELFEKAFKEQSATPLFFDLLNKAFKYALKEAGEIDQPDIATEDLPKIGFSGEVRTFLSAIDEKRFTGQGNVSPAFLKGPSQELFDKIQQNIQEKH